MNVSISVPNDHGSEPDAILMIAELYDGDLQACECDDGRQALDLLADTARDAGLKFVEETDFGAVWSGTPAQIAACRAALPTWVNVEEVQS